MAVVKRTYSGKSTRAARPDIRKSANFMMAEKKAKESKEEADRLNGGWNLTKATAKGIFPAMPKLAGKIARDPLRSAGHIGTGVFNDGIRPMINIPVRALTLNQKAIPKINFEARDNEEEALQKGFGFGGMAGSYMVGGRVLRPLLEAQKFTGLASKVLPKFSMAQGKLKPLTQGLVADQILMQAYADKGTSLEDRAINAAVAPALSLGLHGMGRGANIAASRVRDALGKKLPSGKTADDLTKINLQNASDDEIAQYYKDMGELAELSRFVNPKTGAIDSDRMIEAAKQMSALESKVRTFQKTLGSRVKQPFKATRTELGEYGAPGKTLTNLADESKFQMSQQAHPWKAPLLNAQREINRGTWPKKNHAAWQRIHQANENPAMERFLQTDAEREFYRVWTKFRQWANTKSTQDKIQVKTASGKMKDYEGKDPLTYTPRYYPKNMYGDPDFKENWIRDVIKKGDAKSKYEASLLFEQQFGTPGARRVGPVEHERYGDFPGYSSNPEEYVFKYVDDYTRRATEIEFFGQNNEKIRPLMEELVERGYPVKKLNLLLDEMYGTSDEVNAFARGAMKFEQFTKLHLSFIINATQSVNTAVVGGYVNTFKSIVKYIVNPRSRAAMRDNVILADNWDEFILINESGVTPGRLLDASLYLFKKVERFNRTIAADVARTNAKQRFAKLMADPAAGAQIRWFERAGINVEQIMTNGKLSHVELNRIAYNFVGNTQFRISAFNLPLWSRTTWGKLFTQFKSFGFMQTKFVRDEIVREAAQGNLAPLARWLAAAPLAFLMAKKLRDSVTFRDNEFREAFGLPPKNPDEEKTEAEKDQEIFDALMSMTGMLPAQQIQSMMYVQRNTVGEESEYRTPLNKVAIAAGNLLGPTVSDIGSSVRVLEQAGEIKKENAREEDPVNYIRESWPAERFALNMVPYVGPGLKNTVYDTWPEREREVYRADMKTLVTKYHQTKDPEIMALIRSLIKSKHDRGVYDDVVGEVRREQLPPEEKARYDSMQERKKEFSKLPIYGIQ